MILTYFRNARGLRRSVWLQLYQKKKQKLTQVTENGQDTAKVAGKMYRFGGIVPKRETVNVRVERDTAMHGFGGAQPFRFCRASQPWREPP